MFSSSVVLITRGILPSRPVSTVFSAFERAAAVHAAKPFLAMPSWNVELTYMQALERAASAAARYRALGYGPGHRVVLQLENRPEFLLHFLALNSLGVSVVPLNPDYRESELRYILEHSEASAVITAQTLESLPKPGRPVGATECALLYTSGTTGKPKGCLLSISISSTWDSATSTKAGFARYAPARSASSRRFRSST
jgi:acyl-CoA synthetase (AMP-forming)/AMP-acid ligase II